MDVYPDVIAYGICYCPRESARARDIRWSFANTAWKAAHAMSPIPGR